ncbi:unnamed protein product [Paramecium sonneborni]|uniref:Uncharacterized protein n=1 Tax=Paramecium sonneborni TaxID=65129 RepID=A0A8S1MFK0_9CILI|nr:unnamed protein product [Paramecium sonneborni]
MSKIDWEQKLKQYHALKDRKSITNMLQIKTKNMRLSPSLGSTRAGTEINSFRLKRLKTPIDDGIQQIKTSRSQQVCKDN